MDRQQVNVRLGRDDVEALDGVAAVRFAGNRTVASQWAIQLARDVLLDPASFPASAPLEALAKVVRARGAK